ncbi:MAG: hypothetical protein R3208_08550 [Ketobacteraceae bacterium]|nr:hypothetical protein [Ketobacteraceae bacterium]
MAKKTIRSWRSTALLLAFGLHVSVTYGDVSRKFFDLASPCNPVHSTHCALPFPSDVYAIENAGGHTGIALEFPRGVLRDEVSENIPDGLTLQSVLNGSSGYSAATSVLFDLESRPDLSTLPEDGGESAVAYDLETGERVPLRVQFNQYANSDKVSSPTPVVEIYPRARWQFGHRYVVFLTDRLRDDFGQPYARSRGFESAISNDGSPVADFHSDVIDFVEARGYDREALVALTFFTVRAEDEVTVPLRTLAESVYGKEHPVRRLRVYYTPGYVAAIVTGDILVNDFRGQDGGVIYDTNAAKDNWIRFRLTLPRAARQQKAPVAIYGHGLIAFKETDIAVSLANAFLGIATIAIDQPNHGTRARTDGGSLQSNLETENVFVHSGMAAQSALDHIALLKAVRTSIAGLDVLPRKRNGWWISLPRYNGDGISDIDPDRVFYQGTSLGGVFGTTFVALAPELKGAFLQVCGIGITNILSNSMVWGMFSKLVPAEANGAEALLLKAVLQHQMDYGDAINYAHYFRNPPAGIDPKPVAVVAGYGDGVVPNTATATLAEIAQLPLVGKEYFPLKGVPNSEDFVDGYGVKQFPPLVMTGNKVDRRLAHISFLRPDAIQIMIEWTQDVVLLGP